MTTSTQSTIPFAEAAERPADVELVSTHPARLLPPEDDIRDRTTAEYREWFERLAADVRANGVRQPILACREGDLFRVVDGETRRLAALYAALGSVQVLAMRERLQGPALKVAMLQANALRCDMSDLDYARVYAELMREKGWNQARLVRELNHPQSAVSKRLKVIGHLPADLQQLLGEGEGQIPFSTGYHLARAFDSLGDVPAVRSLAERAVGGRLVREDAEGEVAALLGKGRPKAPRPLTLSVAGASVTLKEPTFEAFKALADRLAEAAKAFEKGRYDRAELRSVLPGLLKP